MAALLVLHAGATTTTDREDNMGGTARAHRRSIWTPRPGMSPNWHIHLGQEPNATMAASRLGEQAPGCQLNMP